MKALFLLVILILEAYPSSAVAACPSYPALDAKVHVYERWFKNNNDENASILSEFYVQNQEEEVILVQESMSKQSPSFLTLKNVNQEVLGYVKPVSIGSVLKLYYYDCQWSNFATAELPLHRWPLKNGKIYKYQQVEYEVKKTDVVWPKFEIYDASRNTLFCEIEKRASVLKDHWEIVFLKAGKVHPIIPIGLSVYKSLFDERKL